MTNDQRHELGVEAVKIVNELSSGNFKVIMPGREDAIQVAEKLIEKLNKILLGEDDQNRIQPHPRGSRHFR